jgi:L-fucose isomerase-like protein
MERTLLHIGLVAAVHPNMPGDDKGLYKSIIDKLRDIGPKLDYQIVEQTEVLATEEDGRKAVDFLNENKVDFTLFLNASLPYGRVALPFANLKSPLGIWSVPEPTRNGVLQLNSFCGLNMLGSILTNYFDKSNIKYKWFYGLPESSIFQDRLRVTLGAIRAMKAARESRIGQIGYLADGFENLQIDERELRRKFGTELNTRHTVEDVVRRAQAYSEKDIEEYSEGVSSYGKWNRVRVSSVQFDKVTRVNKALADIARENGYSALAISCWSKFQEVYGIAVCGAMSRLNEEGTVAACEADVTSALSMLMLNAISGKPSTVNDMVSLDEEDGSINLWHCGVAPKSWANENGVNLDAHFNIGEHKNGEWIGKGVVADMGFKPGSITVFNLRNDFDHFFILTGDIMSEKKGYYGSSGWVNNIAMNGRHLTIPDLINTISTGRVNHHYVSGWGDMEAELHEVAFWKDLAVVEPRPYSMQMQPFV